MIHTEQLRLGNIVLNDDNEYCKIIKIEHNLVLATKPTFWQSETEWGLHSVNLHGVSLTIELLNDCNFIIRNDKCYLEFLQLINYRNLWWDVYFYTPMGDDLSPVYFKSIITLHELQNLFHVFNNKELVINHLPQYKKELS